MKIEKAFEEKSERILYRLQSPNKTRINQRIDLEHTVNNMLIRAPYLLTDVIYFNGGKQLSATDSVVLIKTQQRVDTYQDERGMSITQRWKVCGLAPLTQEAKSRMAGGGSYYDYNKQIDELVDACLHADSPFDFCKYVDVEIAVRSGTIVDLPTNVGNTGSYHHRNHTNRVVGFDALNASRGFNKKTTDVIPYGDYAMILNNRGAQQITLHSDDPSAELGPCGPSLFKHRVQNRLTKKEKAWTGWIPDFVVNSTKPMLTMHGNHPTGKVDILPILGTTTVIPAIKGTTIKSHLIGMRLMIPYESTITIGLETKTLPRGQYWFDFKDAPINTLTADEYHAKMKPLLRHEIKRVVSRANSLSRVADSAVDIERTLKTKKVFSVAVPNDKEQVTPLGNTYTRTNSGRLK